MNVVAPGLALFLRHVAFTSRGDERFLAELAVARGDLIEQTGVGACVAQAPLLVIAQRVFIFGGPAAPRAHEQSHGK